MGDSHLGGGVKVRKSTPFALPAYHLGAIAPIVIFFRRQKPQNPWFSWKTRGFVCIEFGGEGEIRTLDTVSCIHTFQACSLSHSDTSPYLGKLFSLSRRANVVESFSDGKGFFRIFMRLSLVEHFKRAWAWQTGQSSGLCRRCSIDEGEAGWAGQAVCRAWG